MPRAIPLPAWLKSLLVPCWNSAHRHASLAYDYVNSIGHGRFETCTVCGRIRPMLYRRRIITRRLVELWGLSPAQADAFARKESCFCSRCGANLRARRMAHALLSLYKVGNPPTPCRSLAQWVEHVESRSLRVAEINRIDGHCTKCSFGCLSSRAPTFTPAPEPGSAIVDDVRTEDFRTRLTYPDASFDVVLRPSETLGARPPTWKPPCLKSAASSRSRRPAISSRSPSYPMCGRRSPRSILLPDGSIQDRAPRHLSPGG